MFLAFGGGSKSRPSAPLQFLYVFLCVFCFVAVLLAWPATAQESPVPAPQGAGQTAPEPAPPPFDPGLDPEEDQEIAQRLGTIYNTVDGLAPVQVRVTAGVVVLSGEVSTQALREQAARLARNVQGVVEVENRIAVAQDLEGRLTPALERLQSVWYGFVRLLPVLLVSVAIMALAIVINGIAAHHQEVEYACLEAPIVQVADAISASRPGARGESMDTYVKRLEDLQAIAESFGGVERSFAVQAGREVRILVRPEEIDNLTATRLAREIVKKIEEQLTLPGQITSRSSARARRGIAK